MEKTEAYILINKYMYSKLIYGGYIAGYLNILNFESDLFKRFLEETNAANKIKILQEEYPYIKDGSALELISNGIGE